MSTKSTERLHTLDDDNLDKIGYPQTRLTTSIEQHQRGLHRVAAPTKSPPPVLMPKPTHAVPPTQKLVQQPPPAISAPLTTTNNYVQSYSNVTTNGNIGSNSNNSNGNSNTANNNSIHNTMNNDLIQPRGIEQSTSQQSTGSSSNISPTYATPRASLSIEAEADKKKLPNKSVVASTVTNNSKVIPPSTTATTAPSDNSHKSSSVRPQGILMGKNVRSNTTTPSSPSSLRKSVSAATAMSSGSSNPPYPSLQQDNLQQSQQQPRMVISTSSAVRQPQHQPQHQVTHADATHNPIHATAVSAAGTSITATSSAAAAPTYNKVTFEDMQTKPEYNHHTGPEYSHELKAILEQNDFLRREVDLLKRQQQQWVKAKLEMEKVKLEMEREQHLVTNRLEQLEEQLRHYCLSAIGPQTGPSGARNEEKGKAVVHPTHSRSDPTTTSPRKLNKPPSGGGRSPASKRHRSRSVPRFDEDGEHLSRYVAPPQPLPAPLPRRRYEEEYDYDYDDYPPQPETTDDEDEEDVGWEEYSSRRLPPPSFMRQHAHHQFRYPGPPPPPPVVPLAGPNPSLPPPQLPPINRKWAEGRGGSLQRRRSGSLAPFLPRPPVPPHYHTLPPRHHHWRDSRPAGYEGTAGDYGWEEPPPPSHRSSRYYDEPSDDFEDYPPPPPAPSQKRYPPHDRRLSTARDRRSFPAYGTSM